MSRNLYRYLPSILRDNVISMEQKSLTLIGAGLDCGKPRRGCLMGPDALRTAGVREELEALGHRVIDWGNVIPGTASEDISLLTMYTQSARRSAGRKLFWKSANARPFTRCRFFSAAITRCHWAPSRASQRQQKNVGKSNSCCGWMLIPTFTRHRLQHPAIYMEPRWLT